MRVYWYMYEILSINDNSISKYKNATIKDTVYF